ncbi:MAG: hypothetical protein V6Z89_17915 [Desulfobacter sp.]
MGQRYTFPPVFIVVFLGILYFTCIAHAVDIQLYAKDASGYGSKGFPSSFVIPFAPGERQTTDSLALFDAAGKPVAAQFSILSHHWHPYNSVRWIKVAYQPHIDPYTGSGTGISEYSIRSAPNTPAPEHPVVVTENASGYTIGNGLISLGISTSPFSILTPAGNLIPELIDRKDRNQASFDRDDIRFDIETQGPLVTTFKASAPTIYRGPYLDDKGAELIDEPHDILHGWALRISVFANHPYVRLDFQLQNSAKNTVYSGPLYFNSMTLKLDGNTPEADRSVRSVLYDADTITDYDTDAKLVAGNVSAAIQYFHETWPNGLKTDADGNFTVELWPDWSAQYLNTFQGHTGSGLVIPAIQAKFTDTGLYWLEDMQHTVKSVLLHFGSPTDQDMAALAAQLDWQPVTVIPRTYYDQTRATLDMGGIVPEFKLPVQDHTRKGYNISGDDKNDPQNRLYSFGWDNFGLDVERKFPPAMAGGFPYYPARFVATGEPLEFYKLWQFARAELNIRPQWMAGYNHAEDSPTLALNQGPYAGFQWRKLDPLAQYAFAYLPDTWQDVKPRDDQHGWFSHVALAYALTGDPWIRDWYEFIGEFRKSKLARTDVYPDQTHRGIGHALTHALDAYKATGDAELAVLFDEYKTAYLLPARHPENGIVYFPYSAESAAAFQLGYLGRAFINIFHELPSQQTDMLNLVKDMVEWNISQCNFCYYLSLDDSLTIRNSHGWTGMAFADIQAWYALQKTPPDTPPINHVHQFDVDGISGNTPVESHVCDGWSGTEDGSTWPGGYLGRHTQKAYAHSTYVPASSLRRSRILNLPRGLKPEVEP